MLYCAIVEKRCQLIFVLPIVLTNIYSFTESCEYKLSSLNEFLGDACDGDQDGDNVGNKDDNCRLVSNAGQEHVNLNYDAKGKYHVTM